MWSGASVPTTGVSFLPNNSESPTQSCYVLTQYTHVWIPDLSAVPSPSPSPCPVRRDLIPEQTHTLRVTPLDSTEGTWGLGEESVGFPVTTTNSLPPRRLLTPEFSLREGPWGRCVRGRVVPRPLGSGQK